MSSYTVTIPTTRTTEHPCKCGCAPCDETCCTLDCLVQPRFYCGQLLTDQDLNQLLKWSQDKLRLQRYRDGWGVVCGLDVYCDPQNRAGVIVKPGYAISCCGDDIIVCEEKQFDLANYCRLDKDPCADPGSAQRETPEESPNLALDLFLCYHEQESDPQTALGRCGCQDSGKCAYSRTRESYKLVPRLADGDPLQKAVELWRTRYDACAEDVRTLWTELQGFERQGYGQQGQQAVEDKRRHLVRWLDKHPLHHFCFVRDLICSQPPEWVSTNLVALLYLIVQDCRNALLECQCQSCECDSGVRLARVYLERHTTRVIRNEQEQYRVNPYQGHNASHEQSRCHVIGINAYPPHRRPLGKDCLPAPLDKVNLAGLLWHRKEEAATTLREMGFTVTETPLEFPKDFAELDKALVSEPFVAYDAQVEMQVLDQQGWQGWSVPGFNLGGDRVVRFVSPPTGKKATGRGK